MVVDSSIVNPAAIITLFNIALVSGKKYRHIALSYVKSTRNYLAMMMLSCIYLFCKRLYN